MNRTCAEAYPESNKITAPGSTATRLLRAYRRLKTWGCWKWRFHALGHGSIVGKGLWVNNPRAVSIGSGVVLTDQFILADLRPGEGELPKIVIGDGCTILFRFQCNASESVTLGRHVLIASNVLITDSDHVLEVGGIPVTRNRRFVTVPVRIGDNCWLGQNSVILKGVTVGPNSIIGANSVVTRDVPPCSVAAGAPARIIKRIGEADRAQS